MSTETQQKPVGLLYTDFLFSLHDLPWAPKGRFQQLLVREGRQWRGKGGAAKKQRRRFGAGPWFCLKGHTEQCLSSLQNKPPVNRRYQQSSLQRPPLGTRKTHQKTTWEQVKGVAGSAHTSPLNNCCKTPHQILQGWDTQFWEAGAHCVPFRLAKQ